MRITATLISFFCCLLWIVGIFGPKRVFGKTADSTDLLPVEHQQANGGRSKESRVKRSPAAGFALETDFLPADYRHENGFISLQDSYGDTTDIESKKRKRGCTHTCGRYGCGLYCPVEGGEEHCEFKTCEWGFACYWPCSPGKPRDESAPMAAISRRAGGGLICKKVCHPWYGCNWICRRYNRTSLKKG